MRKIKIFSGYKETVEEGLNKFLATDPDIEWIDTCATGPHIIAVTILYEEN